MNTAFMFRAFVVKGPPTGVPYVAAEGVPCVVAGKGTPERGPYVAVMAPGYCSVAANVIGLPSARMPRTNMPPADPSRIGRMVSVTLSPALNVFFDQPRRA